MRKLLDLHVAGRSPSLYLDSDMLFFSRPDALIAWLRDPRGELYMVEDGPGAFADSPAVLAGLLGRAPVSGLNSGILALNDAIVDWSALEAAANALGPRGRAHKWAEQTLFAFLLARPSAHALDRAAYRVCSDRRDLTGPLPVLRHYVNKTKHSYLASEWRRTLARPNSSHTLSPRP